MKIVFWSSSARETGTTSNLTAIALMTSMMYSCRGLLFQSQYRYYKLDFAFMGQYGLRQIAEDNCYKTGGIERLLTLSVQQQLSVQAIEEEAVKIGGENAYYIPLNLVQDQAGYENSIISGYHMMVQKMEQFADIVFIDAGNGFGVVTREILKNADLIVVNFSSGTAAMDEFFEEHQEYKSRMLFLFSSYHKENKDLISEIRKKYRLEDSDYTLIPHHAEFQNAFFRGTILDYLKRNYKNGGLDSNYEFFKQLKQAVFMIASKSERCSLT